MAYTSTSSIGASVWYGPNSCPIISPSRWQTQILDNLCALSLHDHSGSLGEGASVLSSAVVPLSGQEEMITPFFPNGSTNWVLETDINNNNGSTLVWPGYARMSTSTNGASISYDVYLGVGVHTIWAMVGKGSSFGFLTACLSGTCAASSTCFNGYKSGNESYPTGANTWTSVASFQFRVYSTAENAASGSAVTGCLVGSGKYNLVFKVNGSATGSSNGYIARLGSIFIR